MSPSYMILIHMLLRAGSSPTPWISYMVKMENWWMDLTVATALLLELVMSSYSLF